jgi:hypothetical protein
MALASLLTKESHMFTKSLLALGLVAAMSVSMSGAFAQNFDHRDGYRADQYSGYRADRREDYRDMRRDGRDFRNDRADGRGNFRAMHRGRDNFEGVGHGSWQNGHQNHLAMNHHNSGSGHRGRR